MKTTHLFLSLILFSIFTHSLLSAAQEAAPVLDLNRKELRAEVNYHILSVITDAGVAGLGLSSLGNHTCPLRGSLSVVQLLVEDWYGLPLTFRLVNSREGVVRVSTDLNIKFSASSLCGKSTVWKLDSRDESTGQYFITAGGVEGNPGCETINNWFKIEEEDKPVYKLVFCPTVCNLSKVICKDIGIFIQDGKRRLALTDGAPLRFVFAAEYLNLMQQGILA